MRIVSPHSVFFSHRHLRCLLATCLSVVLLGCAKFPDNPGGAGGFRLTFTMTMAAEINPNYIYFVVFNPSTDEVPTSQGPLPVIAPPWGNGFVAGTATHFVRWDTLQSPNYLLYAFRDALLIEYFATGVPINYVDVLPGSRTIKFEVDLAQIAGTFDPDDLKSIQINFLTMNVVPQGSAGDKVWDAIGDGRTPSGINDFLTIPIRNGIYNNATFQNREPSGDCVDPSLDIVNWQIEIRD